MDYAKESLKMHYELKGKIEVTSRAAVDSKEALSLAYTPGVAQQCSVLVILARRPVCLLWKENVSCLKNSAV